MDEPIIIDKCLIKFTLQSEAEHLNYETAVENSNGKNRIAWFTYIPVVIGKNFKNIF